ncbi:MAG TPA: tetratricopeptide repeat protein [Elusimicrobiota bacterium]|nr:tetratricopeptide repeat protein [Elusimicrobiota bacterium]
MTQSKAHKYFNKFTGWAQREGMVAVEEPEAMEEFFISPSRIPKDGRDLIGALFKDWFLLERRLTRCGLTPLDLFIKTNQRRFDKTEAAAYQGFKEDSRFGIFKLTARKAGEWLDLTPIPRGETCRVLDAKGSEDGREGQFLIARLFRFQDHWALSSFVARLPDEAGYHMERLMQSRGEALKDEPISHRFVLGLFVPPVEWEKEGLHRVRARLASLLQRWRVADITVAQIEEDILAAHKKAAKEHPLSKVVLGKAPSAEAAKEVAPLLQAMWNLTLAEDTPKPGPKERSLLADLQRFVMGRLTNEEMESGDFTSKAREITREWLAAPQKELGGKSPRQAILEERRALGNPQQEVGYEIQVTPMAAGEAESQAMGLVNQATDHLKAGQTQTALDLLQKVYPMVKDHPEAYRVLGNMATAYVMSGNREEALAMLKAALKLNPDYEVARNNLGLLESMSPEEFERKHRSGFFRKMNIIKDRR